jgi:UDP-N-acetylmuramoyl-L-alanyl-D-glutamate--2,6-diaminopimelate ligase
MRLHDLVTPAGDSIATLGPRDVAIAGIAAVPERIKPGFLFAALPDIRRSGVEAVPDALAAGAVAVLAPAGADVAVPPHVPLLRAADPHRAVARLSAELVGHRQPGTVVAVTGTCGKTSTIVFVRALWRRLGVQAASLGTDGLESPAWSDTPGLTTPPPFELHPVLARLADLDVTHMALEASSHGLAQHRIDEVRLAGAVFTNLSRDHLDYHGTVAAYFTAKQRLFADLLPAGAPAVINADSAEAGDVIAIAERRGHRLIRTGHAGVEIRLCERREEGATQILDLEVWGRRAQLRVPILGAFQVQNLLGAIGAVIGTGADPDRVLAAAEQMPGVPGRIEQIASTPAGAEVYVDVSHKPGALQAVLAELRPRTTGRLVLVFGCEGATDPGRRAAMGRIAARMADRVIVTDDNPRREDPAAIRAEIIRHVPDAIEIADRAEAIRAAIRDLGKSDLLVIAGKGRQRTQIVAGVFHPFDDVAVAQEAVAALT